ncbi:MAG: hypothetical protein ACLTDS_05280 [Bianqueaceae bacterium]
MGAPVPSGQFQTEAYSLYVLNLDVTQEGETRGHRGDRSVMSDAYGDAYWLVDPLPH